MHNNSKHESKHFLFSVKPDLLDFALLTLCASIVVAVVTVYIGQEHAIYSWDFSGYQEITNNLADLCCRLHGDFPSKLRSLLVYVWTSTGQNYNSIAALPLVSSILVFGKSRLVFIMTSALCYLLPFASVNGALAAKLMPSHTKPAFWLTVLLTITNPAIWLPTLRGYVDAGGNVLLFSALVIYLHDMQLARLRSIVLIGVLFAFSILFRRHFTVTVLSALVAIGIHRILQILRTGDTGPRTSLARFRPFICIVMIGLIMLATICVVGSPFVENVLRHNYLSLYSGYKKSLVANIQFIVLQFGGITWILAILGIVLGKANGLLDRTIAEFIELETVCCMLFWLFLVGHMGAHHMLVITPIVPIGVAALCLTFCRLKNSWSFILQGMLATFCAFNLFVGLAPTRLLFDARDRLDTIASRLVDRFDVISDALVPELVARNNGPLQFDNYDEILRLVKYLSSQGSSGSIYIAASSFTFNASLVHNAERLISNGARLKLARVAEIDSRDTNPIDELVKSEYVVIATPVQHHLGPDRQESVRAVVELFTTDSPFARDFVRLPSQFVFSPVVEVSIFHRIRPTSRSTYALTKTFIQGIAEQLK